MCIILVALQQNHRYPFILAANRDEYYRRPTQAADFWPDHPNILGGRDLAMGGTWLGISRGGRIAAITNHHSSQPARAAPRSRGEIVRNFLQSERPIERYISLLNQSRQDFNGFGLLIGDRSQLHYRSNQSQLATRLSSGIHALSNALLNTPCRRVLAAKRLLAAVIGKELPVRLDDLFEILATRQSIGTQMINQQTSSFPPTLSADAPIFLQSKEHGTRSSTVILVDRKLNVFFEERTFDETSENFQSRRQFEFQMTVSGN